MLSLIGRLVAERPGLAIMITTGTVASARLLETRLPSEVIHQFAPVDRAPWVRRFLDHWRPDLVLWVESDLWPNALAAIGDRGIPAILVNARMSPRSYTAWRRARWFSRRILGTFALCLAQSEADGARLAALGARDILVPGNLKFAAGDLPVAEAPLALLREAAGARPLWLAASTHSGEEALVCAAHRRIAATRADALTIIVPRHPARGDKIAAIARAAGLAVAQRSSGALPAAATAVYVADSMGELGLFYRLAPVAFVGGSLVPHGGQNVLEPARLGAAIIHGPHMTNFAAIVAELAAAGAAVPVGDADALADAVLRLLADDALRTRQAEAARRIALGKDDVLDAVLARLAPFLDRLASCREGTSLARA